MATYTVKNHEQFLEISWSSQIREGDIINFSDSISGGEFLYYGYAYIPAGVTLNGNPDISFVLSKWPAGNPYLYVYGTFNTNDMEISREYKDNTIMIGAGGEYNQTGKKNTYQESGPRIYLEPGAKASFTNTNAYQVILTSSPELSSELKIIDSKIYDLNIGGENNNYSAIIENSSFNTAVINNNPYLHDVILKDITVHENIQIGSNVIVNGMILKENAVLQVNDLPRMYKNFYNCVFENESPYIGFWGEVYSGNNWETKEFYGVSNYHVDKAFTIAENATLTVGNGTELHFTGSRFDCYGTFSIKNAKLYTDAYTSEGFKFYSGSKFELINSEYNCSLASKGDIVFGNGVNVTIQNSTLNAENVLMTFGTGSTATITGNTGYFHFAFKEGANITIKNNDFSTGWHFWFYENAKVDLSGNYWGGRTLEEVRKIIEDNNCLQYVIIDSVLTSWDSSFICKNIFYDTKKKSVIVAFSHEIDAAQNLSDLVSIKNAENNEICQITSYTVNGNQLEIKFNEIEDILTYTIEISQNLKSSNNQILDQDKNGTTGEDTDKIIRNFDLSGSNFIISSMTISQNDIYSGDSIILNLEVTQKYQEPLLEDGAISVYISNDDILDASDILIAGQTFETLENGKKTFSINVPTAGINEGNYQLIVRANSISQNKENNVNISKYQNISAAPVTINIPTLNFNKKITGNFSTQNTCDVYKLTQQPGENIELLLSSGTAQFYVGYGAVPTTENFAQKSILQQNESLIIPETAVNTDVYIMVSQLGSSNTKYTISAKKMDMTILHVTPEETGINQDIHLEISGTMFSADSQIIVTDSKGKKYELETNYINNSMLTATITANTLSSGEYSVTVKDNNEKATYGQKITLLENGTADFQYELIIPQNLGYHILSELEFVYSNNGTTAMDAPLVFVTAEQNGERKAIMTMDESLLQTGFWTYNMPDGYFNTIGFLATGENGSILQPGASNQSISFYWAGWQQDWDFSYPPFDFKVAVIDSNNTDKINWHEVIDNPAYSAEYKANLVKALEENIGTTWGSYVKALNENLRELRNLGVEKELSAEDLFNMILENIDGSNSPVSTLASYVDIYQACPGLDLSLSRTRLTAANNQYQKGLFGYGWNSNWECNLATEEDGTVKIQVPGGTTYTFEPSVTEGYISFSKGVSLEIINGNYRLTDNSNTQYTITAKGQILSIKDAENNTITAFYSNSGKLTSLSHSCGKALRLEYNEQGFISQATISNEHSAAIPNHDKECYKYSYDQYGNLISVTQTFESNWNNFISGASNSSGSNKTSTVLYRYQYDSNFVHCLTKNENVLQQNSYSYAYDDYGRLIEYISDKSKEKINISYEKNTVFITDQHGNTISESYDTDGYILESTDNRGNSIRYKYDNTGNLLSAVDNHGNILSYTYDKNGKCISATDIFNQKTTYTYVGENIKTVTDSRGNTITYTYDAKDRIIRIDDSSSNSITMTYDSNGNMSSQTNARGVTSKYTYDKLGNVLSCTNNDSQITYTYNDDGQLTSYSDYMGNKFTYNRNQQGQITSFTDTKNNVTKYDYNAAGDLAKITYANGKSESFKTDNYGNTISWTTANNDTLETSVNSKGEIIKTYTAGQTVNFSYNAYGDIISANDITLSYAANGNLTSMSYADGRKITYEYNAAGLLLKQSDEKGNVTSYTYDSFGVLDKITDKSGELIVDYDFNRLGQLIKQTNGNGTYTTWQYTEYGEVAEISHFDKKGKKTAFISYSYDENGLCTEKTTSEGVWAYTYDKNGRLLTEIFTDGNGKVTHNNSYTYDAMGNRLTAAINGKTTTYTYNNMNQIVSANGFNYRYDNAGNLLEDEERTYTWTKDHRVASETLKSTGQTWSYGYDALGNRNSITTNGVTTQYTVDINGNVLAEYVNGKQTRTYYHGFGLAGFAEAKNTYYFNNDMLGSTISVTNKSGSVVNSYSYDAFGNTLNSSESVANDFEFVGSYGLMANASGTTFVRARNYDPVTGRWLSMDPLGINGGENLYEYCYNEPITNIDINGTISVTAIAAIAGLTAVLVIESRPGPREIPQDGGPSDGYARVYHDYGPISHVAIEFDGVAASTQPMGDDVRADIIKYRKNNNPYVDIPIPQSKRDAVRKKIIDSKNNIYLWDPCTETLEDILNVAGDNFDYSILPDVMFKELKNNYPQPNDDQLNNANSSGNSGSYDPNDMLGPEGYGKNKSVAAGSLMTYTVMCENDPEFATAPVRWLRINSTLDENFDLDYFTIDAFYLAGNYVKLDGGLESYNQRRVMNIKGIDVTLDFAINLNKETRELKIEVMAIDPETDFMLQNPEIGFLYPNDETGIGDGYFVYTLKAKDDLAHGTVITNKADIFFDFNDVIPTPEASNTIDSAIPQIENVSIISSSGNLLSFFISGSDADSGIKGYNIMYSVDGKNYQNLATISGNTWNCEIDMQKEYLFKVQAIDNAGNVSDWSAPVSVINNKFIIPAKYTAVEAVNITLGTNSTKLLFSKDNFATAASITAAGNNADIFGTPQNSSQWQSIDKQHSAVNSGFLSDSTDSAKVFISQSNNIEDIFFAASNETWSDNYSAKHNGNKINNWTGTGETVYLEGKNKIQDVFIGSSDKNTLFLTDDTNGDAIFLDDIYTNRLKQSRLNNINKIYAGAGNDIIDLTSQRYAYAGTDTVIYGGAGDDTIWMASGENKIFGNSGNDRIVGGAGNDIICGGTGNDSLHGGGGNDIFIFEENFGNDTIEQLAGGKITLYFESSDIRYDQNTQTYTDGKNSVTFIGDFYFEIKYGFNDIKNSGISFADYNHEKIFNEIENGIIA